MDHNPVVVRQDSNVQVISGKFLGDFQRHYDEKGYKIFDWVLETNPLAYFTALVGLSKVVGVYRRNSTAVLALPRSFELRPHLLLLGGGMPVYSDRVIATATL